MLSRILVSIFLLFVMTRYAPAQEVLIDGGVVLDSSGAGLKTLPPPARTTLTVDAVQLVTFYNLMLHQVVGDRVALGFGLRFPRIASMSGRGVAIEVRMHPSPPAFDGFFVATTVSFGDYVATRENGEAYDLRPFSIDALAGWHLILFDHLSLDGGIGFGMTMFFGGEAGVRVEEIPTLPTGFRLGVGYAF